VTRREALAGTRSVGRPLPGWHVYVLDGRGDPAPPGVPGEIYVGGAGVASHYLNRPELTAQRFLADPFLPGRQMYRSGDRGRLLPDGRLEHLGRLDNQVKLRGHRIELDEIRLRLVEHPSVLAAAVVVAQATPGDAATARLAAYVVLTGEVNPDDLLGRAAAFLPDYMVPSTLTTLPALPLTTNGKLDVARLPAPSLPTQSPAEPVSDGSLEGAILAAWEHVFSEPVALNDDFFALGGNSLLAVRLSAAMRERGVPPIALRNLYLHPTPGRLAALLCDEDAAA
jgi:hypothetical protein